jgi:protein-tyrosine-phosphatase
MSEMKEFENVDLFDMEASDDTMNVFDERSRNLDGIYRPNLKDASDKTRGYRAKIRFLPNVLESGKVGVPAVEKHQHYADLKTESSLAGYYDCEKNFKDNCPLCTIYWKLQNSKNQADVERAKLVSRTTKYYSYVLVIEDEQHPEMVGKIMVYSYGYTIKEKIKAQRDGEIGDKCNIFDLGKGKDFQLIIKEKGGYPNYEASQFLEEASLKIWNEKSEKFIAVPVEEGKITDPKVKKKVISFLKERDVNLEDFQAKEWDEETRGKADTIVSFLSGNDVAITANTARNTSNDLSEANEVLDEDFDDDDVDSENFFDDDDDE